MIIDIHTHLGDILHPQGGELIFKKGIKKKPGYDITTHSEMFLHKPFPGPLETWVYSRFYDIVVQSSRARNATATLENMQKAMDEAGVIKSVCLPIPPYLTFDDLKMASAVEPRLIPFTGVDFTRNDWADKLKQDIEAGAKGVKLHPIIQREAMNSENTFRAMGIIAPFRIPVLFHSGTSSYYLGNNRNALEDSSLGDISHARDLVTAFPGIPFIAGHAGLLDYKAVIRLLSGYKNVMVDTSFQSSDRVQELIEAFGPERVLFASDWPYGNIIPAIRIVKRACKGDKRLERLVFYENAASLQMIMNMTCHDYRAFEKTAAEP